MVNRVSVLIQHEAATLVLVFAEQHLQGFRVSIRIYLRTLWRSLLVKMARKRQWLRSVYVHDD